MKIDGTTFNLQNMASMSLEDALAHHTSSEGLQYAWRDKTPEQVKEDLTDLHARAVKKYPPQGKAEDPKPTSDVQPIGNAKAVPASKSNATGKGADTKQSEAGNPA